MGSNYSKGEMIALGAVFSVVPMVATGLRFRARALTRASYGMEDYLIIPATISALATAITLIIGACVGEMGQHQRQVSNAQGNLIVDSRLRNYEKCKYSIQLLSTLSIGLSKLSVVFLCRRIFVHRTFRLIANGYIAFLVCWTIAFFIGTMLQCTPPSLVWTQFEYNYAKYCMKILPFYYASAVTDAFTDVAILILPIPMVWKLQRPWRQRVAIGGMFFLGIVVLGTSFARLGIYFTIGGQLRVHYNDVVYYSSSTIYWSSVEASLAVLSACLPTLRPIFQKDQRVTGRSKLGSSSLGINSKNSRHHRLGGEADSTQSSSSLRREEDRTAGMGVNTYVQSVPLQDLQPEASDTGIWVQKEVWNNTRGKVGAAGV